MGGYDRWWRLHTTMVMGMGGALSTDRPSYLMVYVTFNYYASMSAAAAAAVITCFMNLLMAITIPTVFCETQLASLVSGQRHCFFVTLRPGTFPSVGVTAGKRDQ